MLGPYHFCPLSSPSLHKIFPWRLFAMTHLSWVALHGMAHSSIKLCEPLLPDKAVIHEWGYNLCSLISVKNIFLDLKLYYCLLTRCLNCHSIITINIIIECKRSGNQVASYSTGSSHLLTSVCNISIDCFVLTLSQLQVTSIILCIKQQFPVMLRVWVWRPTFDLKVSFRGLWFPTSTDINISIINFLLHNLRS